MEKKEVKPYKDDGSKKEQVTRMFDKIAPRYDLLNRVLSFGFDKKWRKQAIEQLDVATHKTILDIATGTGDMILEMEKQLEAEEVVGMDISEQMINLAREKITKKGIEDYVKLEVGDSEKMSYFDGYFDAVTVAFGVRNFGDLEKGLAEIHRVLRPGGKLVILEFSQPMYFPFKQIYNLYFKYILPFIGRISSRDRKAYTYLYESVQAFPDYEKFADILSDTGFRSVDWKPLTFGICTIYTGEK